MNKLETHSIIYIVIDTFVNKTLFFLPCYLFHSWHSLILDDRSVMSGEIVRHGWRQERRMCSGRMWQLHELHVTQMWWMVVTVCQQG